MKNHRQAAIRPQRDFLDRPRAVPGCHFKREVTNNHGHYNRCFLDRECRADANSRSNAERKIGKAVDRVSGLAEKACRVKTVRPLPQGAVTMQNMGLLPGERPISWYDPGKFWSGDDLVLAEPFRLTDEIAVLPG